MPQTSDPRRGYHTTPRLHLNPHISASPNASLASKHPSTPSHQLPSSNPTTPTMASPLTSQIWSATVPLHITLAPSLHPSSGPPPPYLLNIPRLSYLPLLLPRLSVFFHVPLSSFTHEGIELRLLPAGLLADLYAPQLPWRIEVGDGWGVGERGVADGFMNSVKEVR